MKDAKDEDVLLSVHLKATMMKVSDPIIFGHALKTYFRSAWAEHASTLEEIGANPNNGLTSIFGLLEKKLPQTKALEICGDFEKCYEERPSLAMANSDKGISNLHCPSDLYVQTRDTDFIQMPNLFLYLLLTPASPTYTHIQNHR